MNTIIKTCPFCGSSATIDKGENTEHCFIGGYTYTASISCDSCDVQMTADYGRINNKITSFEEIKSKLINNWNKRI